MTASVDPTKAVLYPEILPEAMVVTALASGAPIAAYGLYSPNLVVFNSIFTDVTPNVKYRVDRDSLYGTIDIEGNAGSDREEVKLEIPCENSLNLWATGASIAAFTAYTLRIGIPTIFEKIKYGISLSSDEDAIDQQYEISKRYNAGLLKQIDVPSFSKIVEVAEIVTVAAGGNTTVGPIINVGAGQKAVLLSVGTDHTAAPANNDTFLSLTRNIADTNYFKLDTAAMPGLDHDINCYVPSINRLEVILQSATGVPNMPIRYKYGVSDITILEKIRWGKFGPGLTTDEQAIATELDLYNVAFTGVM